jgi:hypothetical protein
MYKARPLAHNGKVAVELESGVLLPDGTLADALPDAEEAAPEALTPENFTFPEARDKTRFESLVDRASQIYHTHSTLQKDIAAIEARIAEEQKSLAERIRAEHAQVYRAAQIYAAIWQAYDQHLRTEGLAWYLTGNAPVKNKTLGPVQIASRQVCAVYDEGAALEWCLTPLEDGTLQGRAFLMVNARVFQSAVKDGQIEVPELICQWMNILSTRILPNALEAAGGFSEASGPA